MLRFAALLLALSLMVPETSRAVSNPNAKILIHLAPPVSKTACTVAQAKPACASIQTAGNLLPDTYFAYVLATDGVNCQGIAGLQFGINYNGAPGFGADIYSWNSCASQEVPGAGWPGAGTGIQIGWDPAGACQTAEPGGPGTGVVATAGYFYVAAYTADALRVIQRPVDGLARITDCDGGTTTIYGSGVFPNPSPLGYAAFSAGAASPGYNPCGTVVQPECTISGPASTTVGFDYNYYLDAITCGTAIQWSVTGNATILSASDDRVTVRADAQGSFTLAAGGMSPGGSFTCSRNVSVILPPPSCHIHGAPFLSPGISGHYSALEIDGASYEWWITGDASIIGPADQIDVTVMTSAAPPDSFLLNLAVTANGETRTCHLLIHVEFGTCSITGPDEVFPAPAIYTYVADDDSSATFAWSVSGNGAILGSATGSLANIQTGPAGGGSLTIMVRITKGNSIQACSKTVTVLEPPPPPPGGNRQAKIMLHVVRGPSPMGCDLGGCCTFGRRPCPQLVTKAGLYPLLYYAAVLVVDGETDGSAYSGISGVQLGLDYNGATGQGVDIYSWTKCAALESTSGGWPAAGSGNLITFPVENCQKIEPAGAGTGVTAQFGYLYLAAYTPDRLSVTVRPSDGIAKVIDCAGRVTNIEGGGVHGAPSPLGFVSFSLGAVTPGYNPCDQVIPVENTTWSRVKSLFVEPATKPE